MKIDEAIAGFGCKNCKHGTSPEYCEVFDCDYGHSRFELMTNADIIRKMSDEELAKFIGGISKCDTCKAKCNSYIGCAKSIFEWLQSKEGGEQE